MVGILMALVVASPMVSAQSNAGAPGDASGAVVVNPGDYPGSCEFPFSLEFSGKAKAIELPNGGFVFTSPGLDVTITNLEELENQATFNITGSVHQSTSENGDVTTVLTGRNFAIDPEAGTKVVIGRFSFIFDAEGNLIQPQTGRGNESTFANSCHKRQRGPAERSPVPCFEQ
jgi:hypothetical protein